MRSNIGDFILFIAGCIFVVCLGVVSWIGGILGILAFGFNALISIVVNTIEALFCVVRGLRITPPQNKDAKSE